MVHDLAQWLEVPAERLCILAALLGNVTLTEHHLTEFHKRISNNPKKVAYKALSFFYPEFWLSKC